MTLLKAELLFSLDSAIFYFSMYMLSILYTILLTLICMVILHHLYDYVQYNFTIPKVYDIASKEKTYQKIEEALQPKEEVVSYLKQFQTTE